MGASSGLGRRFAFVSVVIAASVLPYAGTLRFPFLHDDQWAVVNNPVVTGDLDFVRIVTTNSWGNEPEHLHIPNYRPLSVLTLAITHAAFGLDPVPYRLSNLLLHALCVLLVLATLIRLGATPWIALLGSTWFALHPVHSEVVLFVVNREEMLCFLFWLAALHLAIGRSGLVPTTCRKAWTPGNLAVLVTLTALAVLSKEGGATIPFAVAGIGLLWPGGSGRVRRSLPPVLASGAVVLAYLGLRLAVLGHIGAGAIPWQDNPLVLVPAPERLAGAMAVAFEAFRLVVAPADLSVDYGHAVLGIPGSGTWIRAAGGLAVLALLLAAAAIAMRRGRFGVTLGVLIALVSWAPVSHVAFPSSILLADRLLFLPTAGMALVLAGLLGDRIPSVSAHYPMPSTWMGRAFVVLCIAWCCSFLALTIERAGDYRSAETLFASSLRNRPGSTRLHNNLGLALLRGGRPAQAEAHLRRALEIDPTNAEAHNNLGILLGGIGRPASAAEEFLRALAIRPNMRAAVHNLCLLLMRLGHINEAAPVCEHARALGVPVQEADGLP